MPSTYSFDVTSTIELPEVDNAVNQARKEIGQRFDFKGSSAAIDFDQKAGTLTLIAEDNFKLEAVWDVLQTRLIKRSVAVKNLKRGDIEPAAGSSVRQVITLQQGIPTEAARENRQTPEGPQAQEGAGGDPGRPAPRHLAVERRSAGCHAGAAREGLRHRPSIWQLPLTRLRAEEPGARRRKPAVARTSTALRRGGPSPWRGPCRSSASPADPRRAP